MLKKWKILLIEDDRSNRRLVMSILREYRVTFADGHRAIQAIEQDDPDLILLDIYMPGINGIDICRNIQKGPYHKIPIIFITSIHGEEGESIGLEAGAVDYITKPPKPRVLISRVNAHLQNAYHARILEETVAIRTAELEKMNRDAIHMISEANSWNDDCTGNHIWRMAKYARIIAEEFCMSTHECDLLERAAPMHDAGKIGIPDAILKKPGKLTREEWAVMKRHASIGRDILSQSDTPVFQLAAQIAYCHHERWDGTGYPNGLQGEKIPIEAQITSIADVFDALTMCRPYKEAWSITRAMTTIQENAGTHFNPKLVDIFASHLSRILETKEKFDK